MNKTHWPNTLLILVKDQIIEICNILQLNTILFWFASDKNLNSLFFNAINWSITAVLVALIIAVSDKSNWITIILFPIFEKTLKTRKI